MATKHKEVEAPGKGAARGVFREVVNESATREAIQGLVDGILGLESFVWGHCPNCKKQVQVAVPDLRGRVAGLVALLEQAEGRPEGEVGGLNVVVERVALRD